MNINKRKQQILFLLVCVFFGHKKYEPQILKGKDIITLHDESGKKLVGIHICNRCGCVYSDLKNNK